MKKALLIFAVIILASCSSDDKSSVTIVGNWKFISANTYGSEYQLTKCEKELSYIEFKTGIDVNEKTGVSDGNTESGCTQTTTSGSYVINDSDKELICSFYKEGKLISKKNYFIMELTASSLKLKIFRNGYLNSQNVWVDGDLTEIKRTVYTYTKQ